MHGHMNVKLFNNIFSFAKVGGGVIVNELKGDSDRNGHVSCSELLSLKYV